VKKRYSALLMGAVVLALLMVSALIAVALFFDPNDYKNNLAEVFKEKTGRTIELQGNLELTLVPELSISTGKLQVSNAQGFADQPFALIENSRVTLAWLPLLSKKIVIKRIHINNLIINLATSKDGLNNWQDLATTQASEVTVTVRPGKTQESAGSAFKLKAIEAIDFDNATVNWEDQQADKKLTVKDLNLHTSAFAFNEPLAFELSFNSDYRRPLTESVRLTAALTVDDKLQRWVFHQCYLQVSLKDLARKTLSASVQTNVAFDQSKQAITVSDFMFQSSDLKLSAEINGSVAGDRISVNGPVSVAPFNFAKVVQEWGLDLPQMKARNALNKLATHFDFEMNNQGLALQNFYFTLDESQMTGQIQIVDLASPSADFQLQVDQIDMDRYLPPISQKQKPLASPASALAVAAAKLPAEWLKKIAVKGVLEIQTIKISDLNLQGVLLKLDAKNSSVTTEQSIKQFYQGSYAGHLDVNMAGGEPVIVLDETLKQVQLETLLTDYYGQAAPVSARVDASAQLRGQGKALSRIKSTLSGEVSLKGGNAAIKGVNLQKIIDDVKHLGKDSALPKAEKNVQTLFSELSGTAVIRQGLVQNDDFTAKSPELRLNGKGTADLSTERLNYQVSARLIKSEATATQAEQLHATPIVIHIGGTFGEPVYTLDVAQLLTEKNKAKIGKLLEKNHNKINKLMDKLDKKLGPGASDLLKRLF